MLDALRATLRSRRTLVWTALLTILAVALALVPLFDVLGLEFSFAIGLCASLAAADLSATFVRRNPDVPLSFAFKVAAAQSLVLLVPPLLVISANALRVRSCDYMTGLELYALLPGLSVLAATTAGVVAATVLARAPRLAAVAPWLIVLGSIAIGVYRFYAAPPIFGYDPFAGWFPGAIYDEDLRIPTAFWWARAYHGALCVAALALCATWRRPRAATALGAVLATVAGGVLLARAPALGFAASSADIAAALGGKRETEHFTIYYPRGAAFEPQMDAIAREHELRLRQVARVFGVAPPAHITSFYFATAGDKARWMGARTTYIAKPWRHEIYLSHEEFPDGALRHEIAHVVAGEFGDPIFHVSVAWWGWPPALFNVGLIEGAAVAADWPTRARLTPHEATKAMLALGYLPPLRAILAPGFFRFSSAQSYTTAGSFCRFLIEQYGPARFRALYRAGGRPQDFARIYGRRLEELDAEWRAFIAAVPLPASDREIARERFRRPGIFGRPCPHAIARLEARARALAQGGRPEDAVPLLVQVCRDDPAEPARRLELANAYARAGRRKPAERIYRELAGDAKLSTPLRARASLRLADLLGRAGRASAAAGPLAAALALPVDDDTRRNLAIRSAAVIGGTATQALRAYLFARNPGDRDPDPVLLLHRAHAVPGALGAYLVGRILYGRGEFPDAADALARAHDLGLLDALVADENDRMLATAAFLSGDLPRAKAAAERLAASARPARRRLGEDWLARIEFAGKESPFR